MASEAKPKFRAIPPECALPVELAGFLRRLESGAVVLDEKRAARIRTLIQELQEELRD